MVTLALGLPYLLVNCEGKVLKMYNLSWTPAEAYSAIPSVIQSVGRISPDICYVRMTDNNDFLTIYGHRANLLNNKVQYSKSV